MTVGTAWAIGKVTRDYVAPAVEAGEVTSSQLLAIGGWVAGAVLLNMVGVVVRRVAAGYTMYNVAADFRRQVTRQYLRPRCRHHRHPRASCSPTPMPMSRRRGMSSRRCRWPSAW